MGRLDKRIAEEAGISVVDRGEMMLIAAKDIQRFIDRCEVLDVRILGIEGFVLQNSELRPDTNAIGDFSTVSGVAESILATRRLLEEVPAAHLFFEVTVDD